MHAIFLIALHRIAHLTCLCYTHNANLSLYIQQKVFLKKLSVGYCSLLAGTDTSILDSYDGVT